MTIELRTLEDPSLAEDWGDLSTMKTLTCVHHPAMRYLTKNPWSRNLHVTEVDPAVYATGRTDCTCRFGDLRVVVGAE